MDDWVVLSIFAKENFRFKARNVQMKEPNEPIINTKSPFAMVKFKSCMAVTPVLYVFLTLVIFIKSTISLLSIYDLLFHMYLLL